MLEDAGVAISMDCKGRWIDNVFIERLRRSVKYEEVYLSRLHERHGGTRLACEVRASSSGPVLGGPAVARHNLAFP